MWARMFWGKRTKERLLLSSRLSVTSMDFGRSFFPLLIVSVTVHITGVRGRLPKFLRLLHRWRHFHFVHIFTHHVEDHVTVVLGAEQQLKNKAN